MKELPFVILAFLLSVLSGCVNPTWKINNSKTTVGGSSGYQSIDQSILLNKKTGETWVLSVDGKDFYWKEVPKK